VLELVRHGVNGLICEPDPQAIARAIDELVETPGMAERMGQQGPLRMQELGIHWDRVISRLTA
jgi:glycosyltransferase involved in cell wall biosynthesis